MKKRKERPSALALLGVGKGADKKRRIKRRASDEMKEGEMLLGERVVSRLSIETIFVDANGDLIGRKREAAANVSYDTPISM